jgi:predicted phage tail protein
MKSIHLHGSLRKKYGKKFDLAVTDAVSACKLLANLIPGFRKDMREGLFRVIRGPVKDGFELGPEDVHMPIKDELHIFPVVAGSKSGSTGKIILGAILIGAAIIMTGGAAIGVGAAALGTGLTTGTLAAGTLALTLAGNVALFGAALVLGGVAMAMAPTPKADYGSREDTSQSFLFNGVVNTTEQGGPVPLIYGRFMVGSKVISANVNVEDMAISFGTSVDGSYGGAVVETAVDGYFTA